MKYNLLKYIVITLCLLVFTTGCKDTSPLVIAHLCDPQLGFTKETFDADVVRLHQAVQKVNQLKPDVVLIAGDMVNVMEDHSLAAFFDAVEKIQSPVIYTPGNHDLPEPVTQKGLAYYRSMFGDDFVAKDYKGRKIISANSMLFKSGPEDEVKEHNRKLLNALQEAKKKEMPVIMLTHIPPFVASADEPDEYFNLLLSNREDILKQCEENGTIIWLAGHTHTTLERKYGAISILNGETTSVNFDQHPHGFRLLTIQPDNSFTWEFIGLQ